MKQILAFGGSWVAAGTYFSFREGEVVRLEREGALPGSPTSRWLPMALILLLSPLLGLLFVMFLPIAGLALTVYRPVKALVQKARSTGLGSPSAVRIDREET